MSPFEAAEGLYTLPRRIFLEGNREPFCDPDGYVLPVGEALTAEELLAHSAVLVVAPPWTGKTFFSKVLRSVLMADPADRPLPFSGAAELTCFETLPRGSSVEPSWWENWKRGQEAACWLVDAIDEDARGDRQSHNILKLLRDLSEDARARLHLLCFCRLNEVPSWFEKGLEEIYGSWSPEKTRGLRRLRMAGLTREAAMHYVGLIGFERACRLIRSHGLKHLAPYPVVLQYLSKASEEDNLTTEGVWAGVLKELLRERRDSPFRPASGREVEDLFKVAQTLAAIMTFCGIENLQDSFEERFLPESFPDYHELRQAAREALRTAVFERAGDGFRFSQDHVRQWLAAFALRKMSLPQVRPLLTLETGELNQAHEGVLALLAQISLEPEVRDWIVTQHGGLPDSGAASWSLPDAAKALGKLQEIARSSPWGVSNWREERLKSFGSVPGINEEIARRLEEAQHPAELHLLLGTALVIGAQETVQPAIQIVIDDSQDERARALAADLVSRLGTNDDLAPLSEGLRSLDCRAWSDEALSILASSFHQRNLWSFEETAALAMAREGMGGSWLEYSLVESLSLDQARWLTKTFLLPRPDRLSRHLLREALAKILGQEQPSESDLEILIPLALRIDDLEEMRFASRLDLITFLKRNPASRRRLFLDGMRSDPQREKHGSWGWCHALEGEDTRWLLELIRQSEDSPPWLWGTLYHVSRSGCSSRLRRQVRQKIGANHPDLLQQLDREVRKWGRDKRSLRQTDSQKEHITYSLEPLLRDLLQKPDVELHQKMLRVSRWCFLEPRERPTDLEGHWKDLPADLQEDVLRLCREALEKCEPTPIPDGQSFYSWTHLEAVCFDQLAKQDDVFRLTPAGIRKWFPSWLRAWESDWGISTLPRCFEADRSLSEDLLLEAIRRDVRSGVKSTHFAVQALPPDLWSERLAAKLEEEIVSKPEVDAQVRINLLVRIGRRFPDRARPIAISWADEAMPGPDTESLRIAGIDILLMASPQEGWERLERLTQQEEPRSVLRRMRSLLAYHYGPQADFTAWPAERLSRLEELLFRAFPPEDDPEWDYGEVRSLGVDDDLQSLRDKLPSLLFKREEEEDHTALERLAHRYPRIREWLDDVRAQQGAEGVLAGLGRTARRSPGRTVPLGQMIKLLRDSSYRVLGSAEDLQNVVLEQLQLIAGDARQHLSLLYHPRPRERGQSRERLEEDALQAYLYCRLRDRLPAVLGEKGLKIEPTVDRETLAARDTRNDLKIQAPSTAGRPLTVIVEIKWSDNDKISTSQVEQLGRDYLLQNDLTHGIYLVGWSGAPGRWKKQALGSAPQPRSCPRAWEQALEEQAKLFGIEQPRLLIRPLVLDLAW